MEATAQSPYVTPRMAQMLDHFTEDNYYDLMRAMWTFAAEDRDASQKKFRTKSVESSMRKLCMDRHGPQLAFRLLLSIPAPVVRACIKGNFASQYQTDSGFRDCLYKLDGKHGVYLYTYTVDRDDGSKNSTLTREEIVELVAMMKRYKATKGTIGNQEAGQIEEAYHIGSAHAATNEGKRALLSGKDGGKIDTLCKTLLARWCEEKDPHGTTLQYQGPCGVGYSGNLSARCKSHLSEDLSQSNKCWALVMSCLKVMGMKIRRISVPILKVWHDDQREIAEILVTMLASSLVEDGGFNPTQAGCSNGNAGMAYESEENEVFINRDILSGNLDESEEMIQERKTLVTNLLPLMDASYEEEVEDKTFVLRLQAEDIKNRVANIKDGKGKTKADIDVAKKQTNLKELELAFATGLSQRRHR